MGVGPSGVASELIFWRADSIWMSTPAGRTALGVQKVKTVDNAIPIPITTTTWRIAPTNAVRIETAGGLIGSDGRGIDVWYTREGIPASECARRGEFRLDGPRVVGYSGFI